MNYQRCWTGGKVPWLSPSGRRQNRSMPYLPRADRPHGPIASSGSLEPAPGPLLPQLTDQMTGIRRSQAPQKQPASPPSSVIHLRSGQPPVPGMQPRRPASQIRAGRSALFLAAIPRRRLRRRLQARGNLLVAAPKQCKVVETMRTGGRRQKTGNRWLDRSR
jgi:hypothetical protein